MILLRDHQALSNDANAYLFVTLQWPGCLDAVKPPNAGLKLFGGAAFERCLNEFQVAANTLAFPSCKFGLGMDHPYLNMAPMACGCCQTCPEDIL